MVFETFSALVGALALAYAAIARFIQNRLVDRREMELIQKESKELSAAYDKASKAKDRKRMDEILQKQMEFLPKMNKAMLGQFKPMFIILAIFALFSAMVGALDPTIKDDIRLNLSDDGRGCDRVAGDGTFSACYRLDAASANPGKWTVVVNDFEGNTHLGKNETYFLLNPTAENLDTYIEMGTGEELAVSTDKEIYSAGDTVSIFATPANMTKGSSFLFIPTAPPRKAAVSRVEATLSNGTYFRVDLPFAIPVLDIRRIYQPYTWFIMISLIANLVLSFAIGQYEKGKKAKEEAGAKGTESKPMAKVDG
jgi:Integral membrane protein EMC3/TMCO1-like